MKKYVLTVIVLCLTVCFSSCISLFTQTDSKKGDASEQICESCSLRFSIISQKCEYCSGVGYNLEICTHCNGTGTVKTSFSKQNFSDSPAKDTCFYCGKCRSCCGAKSIYTICDNCRNIKKTDCPDC